MSTVDVVIPCYNYARYLRGCVHSVLSQPAVDVRVLIIDDGSSDDSAQVAGDLVVSDRRVEFHRHETNRGHIATYNEGLIDWSRGDYTVLLSADDILAPASLSRAVQIMNADASIGMVYGRAIHFEREDELPTIVAPNYRYTRFSGAEWLEARCRAGHNVISSPEVVVRGSIQRAVGGYRSDLPHTGDLEMWLRIAAVSSLAYVRRVPQAFYRVHPASMLRTKFRDSFLDLQHRKAAFDSFFCQYQYKIAGADRLRGLAARILAREALWCACRAYDRDRVKEARVPELVDFAMDTYPASSSLSEYAALYRRRRLGSVVCNRTQLFAATALARRARRWWIRKRWMRTGI